jgi:hypothetical protein
MIEPGRSNDIPRRYAQARTLALNPARIHAIIDVSA